MGDGEWRASSPSRICPECGAASVRPALFGMPAMDVVDAMESGEIRIVMGGCALPWAPMGHGCVDCDRMLVETVGGALITEDKWVESGGRSHLGTG